MDPNMTATTRKEKKAGREFYILLTEVNTSATLKTTPLMGKEPISGLMEKYTKDNGKIIK